jgi:hypothetical protein
MNKKQILLLCIVMLCPLVAEAETPRPAGGVRAVKSLEFRSLDGPVRLQDGRVVFSHYEEEIDAHNAVLLNPRDGSFEKAVAGIPGARFIAEDSRYLVYSSRGDTATPLTVRDKSSGKSLASTDLTQSIQWGHIDKQRLIVVQSGGSHMQNSKASALIYSLPALKLEKTAEITGGNETALWENKIVSIGLSLGIYDLNLRKVAQMDMPPRDAESRNQTCGGGPLRIAGDTAVIGANCGQLVVVNLPSARIERIIRTDFTVQSFDLADGLIYAVSPATGGHEVRVIELASGVELARLDIDADFVATQGNRLLAMKKGERFGAPVQFTLYEMDTASITSETARGFRLQEACRAAERSLSQGGDLYAAIESCELSGIRGFIDSPRINPELTGVIGNYAVWLTRTLSRYNEGIALLERLVAGQQDERFSVELAAARQKARYLDPSAREAPAAESPGIQSVAADFGGSPDAILFEDDRVYIARWLCNGKQSGYPGVILDILDRTTFQSIKQVEIALCDFGQQDHINTIVAMPGYIVLGLKFTFPRPERPTVVVLDAESLTVIAKGALNNAVARLQQWKGRLLACAATSSQRFDMQTARLVPATGDESRACARGEVLRIKSNSVLPYLELGSEAETARFRIQRLPAAPESTFQIIRLKDGKSSPANIVPRSYLEVLPVSERDALVMSYANGAFRRFILFDLATRSETVLFELNPAGRAIVSAVQGKFLFISLGSDLLVYDLERRMAVKYEKDLVSSAVTRLFIDRERLIVTTDSAAARVIDLDAYLARLPDTDFFGVLPLASKNKE